MAQRMMALVHAAMFDSVNSIERRYRPISGAVCQRSPAVSKEARRGRRGRDRTVDHRRQDGGRDEDSHWRPISVDP